MSQFTMAPKSWASWDFFIQNERKTLATIAVSSWKEKGVLTVEERDYRVFREGAMSGDFILERDGRTLARAAKPSAFRSSFEIRYNDRHYILRKKSAWSRAFVLFAGENEVGSLRPESTWTRRATVVLPDEWPRHMQVFVTWLAIMMWRRDSAASA